MPQSSIEKASEVQIFVDKSKDFNVVDAITEYVKLDNTARTIKENISTLQKRQKDINAQLKILEKPIIVSLNESNYSSITINDGVLKPKIEKRVVPTNKTYIHDSIKDFLILNAKSIAEKCSTIENIEQLSKDMAQFILKENRQYTQTPVLRRKINK